MKLTFFEGPIYMNVKYHEKIYMNVKFIIYLFSFIFGTLTLILINNNVNAKLGLTYLFLLMFTDYYYSKISSCIKLIQIFLIKIMHG